MKVFLKTWSWMLHQLHIISLCTYRTKKVGGSRKLGGLQTGDVAAHGSSWGCVSDCLGSVFGKVNVCVELTETQYKSVRGNTTSDLKMSYSDLRFIDCCVSIWKWKHICENLSLLVISQIFHLWFCVWLSPSVVTELTSDPHFTYLGVLRIIPLWVI